MEPPDIQLRRDFDRCLPHIHPGSAGDAVRPCYFEGNTRELLHQAGILTIINQLVDWLDKAATGELINYSQGWEPIRRDFSTDVLIADLMAVRNLVKDRENQVHFPLYYQRFKRTHLLVPGLVESKVYAHLDPIPIRINQDAIEKKHIFQERAHKGPNNRLGVSLALLAYPDKAHITSHYQPDMVQTLQELCDRASAYGCRTALELGLAHLAEETGSLSNSGNTVPVYLLLCARRPVHLIGSDSALEIIGYKIESPLPLFRESWDKIRVHPVSLYYSVNPTLLRQMSALPPTLKPLPTILLGAGSLGSKMALHLARAGAAPKAVIDSAYFMPHHSARHGLTTTDFIKSKSEALAEAIQALGQETESLHGDIMEIISSDKDWRALVKGKDLVINTTASLAVRNVLSMLPNKKLPVRVLESALYTRGKLGVMTLEGKKRNPNTSDMMLEVYEYARHHPTLQAALFSETGLSRQAIGQGCGSMTMPMPDTDISALAAPMSRKLLDFQQQGLPEEAMFWIGMRANDGMTLTWVTQTIPPYTLIRADNDLSWTIRISARAHAKIQADCQLYPSVETGGIVVGAVSEARGVVTIIDILPAPADSKRSPVEFTLGTQGVKAMLKEYSESSNYVLTCVGTWHSHLINVGASRQDYQTAAVIAESTPGISSKLQTITGPSLPAATSLLSHSEHHWWL